MPKTLRIILAGIFAAIAVISAIKLAVVLLDYRRADNIYTSGLETVVSSAAPPESATESADPEDTAETVEFPDFSVDFAELQAQGPDVVGWLLIPDTDISYPLVQGADNDEYLYKTYNGVENRSGSIFLDYRCDATFTGWNTIIYGHNMLNGTMFSTLEEFASQEYFDAHPYVYILTPDAAYRYRFFSAYVTEADSRSYRLDRTKAAKYIENAVSQSLTECDIVPQTDDRLILLSTCTSDLNNDRFVLHAVLDAERAVDTSSAAQQENEELTIASITNVATEEIDSIEICRRNVEEESTCVLNGADAYDFGGKLINIKLKEFNKKEYNPITGGDEVYTILLKDGKSVKIVYTGAFEIDGEKYLPKEKTDLSITYGVTWDTVKVPFLPD